MVAASHPDPRRPLGLVWAVSGRGMLLRCVFEASEAGLLPIRLLRVVTDRPCEFELFAAQHEIPLARLAPPDADRSRFDAQMAQTFATSGADWAGLTFNRLIGRTAIEAMGGRVLNVHFALLPLFPGFGGVSKAVASGMRVAGATLHLVDEFMDTGSILAQAARGVAPADTAESLGGRLFDAAAPLLLQVLRALTTGDLTLDADRRPVWSSSYAGRPSNHGFPAIEADLLKFAKDFCRTLAR